MEWVGGGRRPSSVFIRKDVDVDMHVEGGGEDGGEIPS